MDAHLRRWYVRMLPRLEAEKAMFWARVFRVARYSADDFQRQMAMWNEIASGGQIGQTIDHRGRMITDSMTDFVKFYKGDTATLAKYGVT